MKEILLKLIYACIDNKAFYPTSHDYNRHTGEAIFTHTSYLWKNKCLVIPEESFNYYDHKLMEQIRILHMNLKVDEQKNVIDGMTIKFIDQPSIIINLVNKVLKEEVRTEVVYTTSKSTVRKRFGGVKEIQVENPHTLHIKEQDLKLNYRITSGSISADISEEEFNEIVAKFNENKIKFETEHDMEKINERIERYKK